MIKYCVKRLVVAVATILLIATITFLLMNAVPGSPFLSERGQSPQVIAKLEAKYGMDKPLIVQLKNYLVSFVQGDMGVSIKMQKNREVSGIIAEKFPVSVKVGVIALVWAVLVGIPLGCLAAYNRGKWIDSLLRIITTAGNCYCFTGHLWCGISGASDYRAGWLEKLYYAMFFTGLLSNVLYSQADAFQYAGCH